MDRWVEKTIAYLNSERGRKNWKRNEEEYGFNHEWNMVAAVQAATHLLVYERIIEVIEAVEKQFTQNKAA